MSLLELFLLSCALAADAFTVGAGVGLEHRQGRQIFRLSFHFGLFQALMALLGILGGLVLLDLIRDWAPWIAFLLLAYVGARMIRAAASAPGDEARPKDPTRGGSLVGLSLAVSLDALAAGVGLGASGVAVWLAVLLIGLVSALATLLAFGLAERIHRRVGRHGGRLAGLILLALGVKILLEHLFA